MGTAFVLFAEPLVGLFTREPAVAAVAALCLRVVSYGFLFYAYGMVIPQSFNGAGDTTTPTLINRGCFWLWEIPLAYVLARHAGLGPPRRVHGDHDCLLDARRRERRDLPARALEAASGVARGVSG